MSQLFNDQIYWIEVGNIKPNPYQPRKEFDDDSLADLADSIRQYGILQPLTVTKVDTKNAEGKISSHYELIAGERRLRASKIAGLPQVPVIIRSGDDNKTKLELAIIENLQREDLNAIDRALAFNQLVSEFGLSHAEVGKKMGKSREYVSNSIRLISLPDYVKQALVGRQITEGHTRPLMSLNDRPHEQQALFKDIVYKKMTVREAETIARGIAVEKNRKKETKYVMDNTVQDIPAVRELSRVFRGAKVSLMGKDELGKGKLIIDDVSEEDIEELLAMLRVSKSTKMNNTVAALQAPNETAKSIFVKSDTEKPLNQKKTYHVPLLERLSKIMYHKDFENHEEFVNHHKHENDKADMYNKFSV